jgi:DinB superfamily
MEYQHEDILALLTRTPATLQALLAGLPDTWARSTEGEDTWSAYDVVGHLLHGEQTDWIPRARIILEQGKGHPFAQFDRAAMFDESAGASLDDLLASFTVARAANIATLQEMDITPAKLVLTGTHPSFGTVTLSNLLATWAIHDLNHLGQIAEVMAHQYATAVGPWKAYLAILTRPILTE